MANPRPVHTYYLKRTRHQATEKNHDRKGRATTVEAALVAATRRIVNRDFARCDVYAASGRHLYSLVRWEFGIRIEEGRRKQSFDSNVVSYVRKEKRAA